VGRCFFRSIGPRCERSFPPLLPIEVRSRNTERGWAPRIVFFDPLFVPPQSSLLPIISTLDLPVGTISLLWRRLFLLFSSRCFFFFCSVLFFRETSDHLSTSELIGAVLMCSRFCDLSPFPRRVTFDFKPLLAETTGGSLFRSTVEFMTKKFCFLKRYFRFATHLLDHPTFLSEFFGVRRNWHRGGAFGPFSFRVLFPLL